MIFGFLGNEAGGFRIVARPRRGLASRVLQAERCAQAEDLEPSAQRPAQGASLRRRLHQGGSATSSVVKSLFF
jgi:hypothetical protein